MACRVFRKIKLGRVNVDRRNNKESGLPVPNVQQPIPKRSFNCIEAVALGPVRTPAVEITKTVTVEYFNDDITTAESSS